MRNRRSGVVRWREDIGKYVIDYYDNLGRRYREAIGTNEHDAYRMLHKKIEEIDTGTFNSTNSTETFKAFSERWLKGKVGLKEATRTSYEGILENHLLPYFEKARISEVRRKNIQDFTKQKTDEGKLSPKSIHNILRVLHQILEDAQVEGLIVRNPYLKIEKPKRENPEVDYLRTWEIPIFLKACEEVGRGDEKVTQIKRKKDGTPKKKRERLNHYALFYTDIFTGMRRGELLAVRWSDVDWINRKIHVRRSLYKGGFQTPKSEYSRRAIDMGPLLIQILKEHRARQNRVRLEAGEAWKDNDLIFCQRDGTPLDPDNLYHRDFQSILEKAELRSIRIHDLRHTYAALMISAGHNLKYIQNQMGHSSIKVTMDLYGHLMPEVHDGAAKKTEDFVFGPAMVPETKKGVTAETATP
jgi:integrase